MNGPTSAELERDAERARAEVNDTAERLRSKMTPGQILDEVRSYMKDGNTALTWDNLKTQVRDNPMALALIGTGLAWLIAGDGVRGRVGAGLQGNGHGRHRYADPWGGADHDGGQVSRPGDDAEDAGPGFAERVSETAAGVRDGLAGFASGAGDTARSAGHSMSATMHGASDRIGSFGSGMRDRSASVATGARNSFADLLEREPLIVGALGIAVGAAIGALLPATRLEEEQFGRASAKMRERVGEAAESAWAGAGEAASQTLAAARDAADREGLSADALADKAERIAEAAADAAEDEAGRAGRSYHA